MAYSRDKSNRQPGIGSFSGTDKVASQIPPPCFPNLPLSPSVHPYKSVNCPLPSTFVFRLIMNSNSRPLGRSQTLCSNRVIASEKEEEKTTFTGPRGWEDNVARPKGPRGQVAPDVPPQGITSNGCLPHDCFCSKP